MRRSLAKTFVLVVAAIALVCAIAYGYLRRSLPRVEGTITVAGIAARVDIIRDADAVPHIYASTKGRSESDRDATAIARGNRW